MDRDYDVFDLGEVLLQSGEALPGATLAYKARGRLNAARDNAIVLPTYYTGTHEDNERYIEACEALDPGRWFIVSVNLLGNGVSSSPSNTPPPFDGPRFPRVTLNDNVRFQHRLLTEHLGVERVALVTGWSMAGMQSYQWGAQYPDMVDAIMPFCASARVSPHNYVFLDGVRVALQADCAWDRGDYTAPPVTGLKAFARVYAGWGYSQTFYREKLHRELGFETVEELLVDWENDHLHWDANDLLAKIWTWQHGDISDNDVYGGDLERALGAIRAHAIVIPCTTDLYFPPDDNEIEVRHMPNAELRPFESPWGHCVATPGARPDFTRFIDDAMAELLAR